MDERLVAAYDYQLPKELIAQRPAERRDASRLMLVRDDLFEDHVFSELPQLLREGDLLVLNETRVIPARLFAHRTTGARVELLLVSDAERAEGSASRHYRALLRPSKRVREGERLTFRAGEDELGFAIVGASHPEGVRDIELRVSLPLDTFFERAGRLPLPPYIHNESDEAQRRYQTVFARIPGSIAAPTAALHFTSELLDELARRGIEVAELSLDVGLGTFAPVRGEHIDGHRMHAEHYNVPQDTAERITLARQAARRVVAVGTTVVRALEGCVVEHGTLRPCEGSTSLFITPGFRFRVVDAMITNFHLPRSTLLMLVSAFAGRERMLRAYRAALERRYRFLSFGDAMLLEPALAPKV